MGFLGEQNRRIEKEKKPAKETQGRRNFAVYSGLNHFRKKGTKDLVECCRAALLLACSGLGHCPGCPLLLMDERKIRS